MGSEGDRVREGLTATIAGPGRGRAAAARLCTGCVDLLAVDGASLSIVSDGAALRSLGASGAVTAEVTELQFTLGEGPGLDAVTSSAPVLVTDLNGPDGERWPAFAGAATRLGMRAVFALPVTVAGFPMGALSLCRTRPGPLAGAALTGGYLAAELAVNASWTGRWQRVGCTDTQVTRAIPSDRIATGRWNGRSRAPTVSHVG